MKISNSKKQLAKIIHENGGWRDGVEWAAQDKRHCGQSNVISFYEDAKPWFNGGDFWRGNGVHDDRVLAGTLVPNWRQTILSRSEYFHLYPATDADGWIEWRGGECPVGNGVRVELKYRSGDTSVTYSSEKFRWNHISSIADIVAYRLHKPEAAPASQETKPVPAPETKPTIEQLAADYRNAKDYAERKQQEADAAKVEADAKLAALVATGKEFGLVLSVAEPELVITDWRDLRVGDEIEYLGGTSREFVGLVGTVELIDEEDDFNILFRHGDKGGSDNPANWMSTRWCSEFRFIRRP